MIEGGPYDKGTEVFKCTDCGAVTYSKDGFNGEPDPSNCHAGCKSREGDWRPGSVSSLYKENFDRIFPNAPGKDL